jgi:hypothetical protein
MSLPPVQSEEDRARAEQAEQARKAARPSAVCGAQQARPFAFRKKVLVLALPVRRPIEAFDLPGLATAWSDVLQQRLQTTDRFLMRNGNSHVLDLNGNVRKQITTLAQLFDAQFVITGQIISLGVHRGRFELGALGSIAQPFGDRRVIETHLEIFDGQSGARLKQLNHTTEASGTLENQGNNTLRGDFFLTPLGKAVAKMLDQQGEDVADELVCLPLQARIVRAELKEVHIDAGFTSNIKPGDQLHVLQRLGFPGAEGGEGGQTEKVVGTLLIKQVFPESAVGVLEGDSQPDWRLNGFVRAW